MEKKLRMGGHAWNRCFFYVNNHRYHEISRPGGAAMLAGILGADAHPVALPENTLCEHIQLINHASNHRTGYYKGEHAGWSGSPETLPTEEADALVVWDEGFGNITLPNGDIPILWASRVNLPERALVNRMRDRGLLMLDVDVLRKSGAMISRQVSWERSAADLIWQITNNPTLCYMTEMKHIVITFAEDAAVYITREGMTIHPLLVLNSGEEEGSLRDKYKGALPDTWAYMVAYLAKRFRQVLDGTASPALYAMLKVAQQLMQQGFDPEAPSDPSLAALTEALGTSLNESIHEFTIPAHDNNDGAVNWHISCESKGQKLYDMATRYVREGEVAIDGLPRLTFGALTTVDRREIEAFQNIKNLITEYARRKTTRPLSIAVFGAPGSGKSFGVTQIAEKILPELIKGIEFNVSQFHDINDLTVALHQVRDMVLKGKIPLVFFDEFDSARGNMPLGWIKSFLMPMQDGAFTDEGGKHPVGKCIFIFAGGTSHSFDEFAGRANSDNPEEKQRFKEAKCPDFISRLRGTVDILGPNPTGDNDRGYLLRRGILLRSLCKKASPHESEPVSVSDDILKAMLLIPEYRHGARSMEAILDMSRIEGLTWKPASLPFKTQLSLHVDADAFMRLVLNEIRLNSFTEKLAEAIHFDYTEKQKRRGDIGPFVHIPWRELPEDIRESNRRQARTLTQKLIAIDCHYDDADTNTEFNTSRRMVREFSETELLIMARLEHDIWMDEKKAKGFTYFNERNDSPEPVESKKTGKMIPALSHPDLLPWDELSNSTRQKDFDSVKNIIPLLESIGLRVYRRG